MLNEILNGKRAVTSDFALLVEAALGINPELLINMQTRYNMAQARMKPAFSARFAEILTIIPVTSWITTAMFVKKTGRR